MNRTAVALTALLALTLVGCAGAPDRAPSEPETVATVTTDETPAPEVEEAEKMSAANTVDITAPGEVCDPHNANDSICAAFYPDQLVLNITSPERSREPLASMPDAEKIALAQHVCGLLDAGQPVTLVDTVPLPDDPATMGDRNNQSLTTAGAMAYCPEHAQGKSPQFIAYYQELGEEGAKADFSDKTMPQL